MGIGAGIAAVVGGVVANKSSRRATKAQTKSNKSNIALQRSIYNDQKARFEPFRAGGLQAFNQLTGELQGGFQESPGYQFAVDEGQRAIEGSAAMRGNVRSGATLKALQDRRMGMANQEYGNYMNRLAGVAQMGQASAGNQAAAGANFGAQAGNSLMNIGNAQSAGAIAQGNAITGGINNVIGAYQMNQLMGGGGGINIGGPNSLFGGNSWG